MAQEPLKARPSFIVPDEKAKERPDFIVGAEDEEVDFSFTEMLGNIPGSTAQLADDTIQGAVEMIMNPIETGKMFLELGKGLQRRSRGEFVTGDVAEAFGSYVSDRYGSVDKFQETLMEDPAGVFAETFGILWSLPRTGTAATSTLPSRSASRTIAKEQGISVKDKRRADKLVAGALEADELPPGQAVRTVEGTVGAEARVADVAATTETGAANVSRLNRIATNVTERGRKIGASLTERRNTTLGRMRDFVQEKFFEGRTVKLTTDRIKAQSKATATANYEQAYRHQIARTPALEAVMREEAIAGAASKARELLIHEKADFLKTPEGRQQFTQALKMLKDPSNPQNWNMVGMDYLKRTISSKARGLAGDDAQLSRSIGNTGRRLKDELVHQSGDYKEALRAYRGSKSAEEAIESGRTAFAQLRSQNGKPLSVLVDEFNDLTPDEQSLYRLGMAESLEKQLGNVSTRSATGDLPPSVLNKLGGSENTEGLLKHVLGNDADDLIKLMNQERTFRRTDVSRRATEAEQASLQEGLTPRKIIGKVSALGTDVLFALNQNRFATLRLIEDALGGKTRRIKPEVLNEVARVLSTPEGLADLKRMADITGQRPSWLNAIQTNPSAALRFVSNPNNLKKIVAFGAAAAVIERNKPSQQAEAGIK